MVEIVAPAKEPAFVISAAVTARDYATSGRPYKLKFLSSDNADKFWSSLHAFVDPKDKSLVILGISLPSKEAIEKLPANKGSYLISYVPSSHDPLPESIKDSLRDKGILVVPEREPYECFMADTTENDRKWLKYARILSLEKKSTLEGRDRKIIAGLVEAALQDPRLAVEKILKNESRYFEQFGSATPKKKKGVSIRKIKDALVVESDLPQNEVPAMAFFTYLSNEKGSVCIKGKERRAIFTDRPNFAGHVLGADNLIESSVGFHKARLYNLKPSVSDDDCLALLGKTLREEIAIDVGSFGCVGERTLRRRIVGETTKQAVGEKVYEKKYHSMRDKDPAVEMKGSMILASNRSYEDILELLNDVGAEYEVV